MWTESAKLHIKQFCPIKKTRLNENGEKNTKYLLQIYSVHMQAVEPRIWAEMHDRSSPENCL